jgi:hypothetical protein
MTFVITQQARGMQFERASMVVKVEAKSYAEAIAKAGAILRRLAGW